MNAHLSRAQVLIDQGRFDLAEPELRSALALEPDDALAHARLAQCLNVKKQYDEATEEARTAIRLAPDWSFAHSVLGWVLFSRNRVKDAEIAVREAIRLNPDDPYQFAQLSEVHIRNGQWPQALEVANQGLALDAQHVACTNCRAMAMAQLGRRDEAAATLGSSLTHDPQNAQSHANQGLNYLYHGNTALALEHLGEALRLDPHLEAARRGMIEALKARHAIYGFIVKFLWVGRSGCCIQWLLILGGFVAFNVFAGLAPVGRDWPAWMRVAMVGYVSLVLLTLLSGPLFNLMLCLDRFGRRMLSGAEIMAGLVVVALLAAAVTSLAMWVVTDEPVGLIAGVFFGFVPMPVLGTLNCPPGRRRIVMSLVSLGLAALLVLSFVSLDYRAFALQVFVGGTLGSIFFSSYLQRSEVKP